MPPERRGRPPVPAPAPDPGPQDRSIRALMSLVDDLTIESEEEGLLRATLEHVVSSLALSSGVTFVQGADGELRNGAQFRFPDGGYGPARELSRKALERRRPQVKELADGGWRAATPREARQREVGALVLHDTGSSPPDLELLNALGKQLGNGLENVRLYAELRASSTRIEAMNRITAALTSGSDLKTVVPAFAREVGVLQEFDRLACGFVNDSGDYIEVVCHPEGTAWGLGDVIPVVGSGPGSVVLNNTP